MLSAAGVLALALTLVLPLLSAKVGDTTVNGKARFRESPPPEPAIVTVLVPAEVEEAAVNVAVTGCEDVTVGEENVIVTPAGAPVAESVTGALNPPCAFSEMVAVAELPAVKDTLEAGEERE